MLHKSEVFIHNSPELKIFENFHLGLPVCFRRYDRIVHVKIKHACRDHPLFRVLFPFQF